MAISVITFLYVLAGISLKQVSILGNTLDLTNPDSLGVGLWIAWGYWFWRFVQYFRELKYGEPRTVFEREMPAVLLKTVKKRVLQNPDFKKEHAKCRSRVKAELTSARPADPKGIRWVVSTQYEIECHGTSHGVEGFQEDEVVKGAELLLAKFRVVGRVALRTPYFTEYWLPVVLASLPLIAVVYRQVVP